MADDMIKKEFRIKMPPKPEKKESLDSRAKEQPQLEDAYQEEETNYSNVPSAKLEGSKAPKHSGKRKHEWPRLRSDEDEDDIQAITHMKGNMKKDPTHKRLGNEMAVQKDTKRKAETASDAMGKRQRASTGSTYDEQLVQKYMSHIQDWELLKNDLIEIDVDESILYWPYPRYKMADYVIIKNGKRRSGKTTLSKNIMRKTFGMFPEEYIFTRTKDSRQWDAWYPQNAQFPGYSDGVIWELQNQQKDKVARNIRAIEHWKEYEDPDAQQFIKNPYVRLLMDDCIDNNMHYSETIASIGYYGRHDAFMVDINTQFGHAVNTGLRGNCDLAFGFSQVQKNQRDTFREEYWGFAGTKGTFDYLYDTLTEDFHFVALHNAMINRKNKFEVAYHGSPDRHDTDPVMLGSQEFWDDLEWGA